MRHFWASSAALHHVTSKQTCSKHTARTCTLCVLSQHTPRNTVWNIQIQDRSLYARNCSVFTVNPNLVFIKMWWFNCRRLILILVFTNCHSPAGRHFCVRIVIDILLNLQIYVLSFIFGKTTCVLKNCSKMNFFLIHKGSLGEGLTVPWNRSTPVGGGMLNHQLGVKLSTRTASGDGQKASPSDRILIPRYTIDWIATARLCRKEAFKKTHGHWEDGSDTPSTSTHLGLISRLHIVKGEN